MGPLVIAGVVVEEKNLKVLKAMGVKDSKLLTQQQRERLYPSILKMAEDHVVIKIPAREIDELRKVKNLNRIEADRMAEIIRVVKADKAYVDAPQVSTEKFRKELLALAKNHTEIIAENYADKKYVIVGAASIIAKVERDREIERIKREVETDFGVGYSHDQRTISFLQSVLKKQKKFPDFVRKSWITAIDIKDEHAQRTLKHFKKIKIESVEDD